MSELIESSEFGDWLMGEISTTRRQLKSANAERAHTASQRLESLQVAKQVLLEFLTRQQAMLDAATEARRLRPLRIPSDVTHPGSVLPAQSLYP
jgi:uncharacterized protein YydD (DUF2326 family)